MKIAIFGGSFDPVHNEHIALVKAALKGLNLDKLIVMPAGVPPHKVGKKMSSAEDRLAMCRLAFHSMTNVEVSDYEISRQGTSYSYLTCRHFRALYPTAELYLLVGTDMFWDFFHWKEPDDILQNVTLAVCRRNEAESQIPHEQEEFFKRFGRNFAVIPYNGKEVSSTNVRLRATLGLDFSEQVSGEVREYILSHGLYRMEMIEQALRLEKEKRAQHSKRVCLLAMEMADHYGIDAQKAFIASALHDVAKNLPMDDGRLQGFVMPSDVPTPVLHQYTGAYVLEHTFGVHDEDVLNAVRYHTSGRAGMSNLEMLVFLADMLEEGRDFPEVDYLRSQFKVSLPHAMYCALLHQVKYLQSTGGEIYPLTLQAFEYYQRKELEK